MTKKGKLYKYFSETCAKPTNLQKTQNTKVEVIKVNEPCKKPPKPKLPKQRLLCTYKSDKRAYPICRQCWADIAESNTEGNETGAKTENKP